MASFKETIKLPEGWWWRQDAWNIVQASNHDNQIWVTSMTKRDLSNEVFCYTEKANIHWKSGTAKITADIIDQLKQAGTIAAAMNAYFKAK